VFAALNCEVISGNLKQIDAGSGSVVGVNNQNEAFVLIDNTFRKIGTSLKHISVGPAGQLGVNTADQIFKLQGGSFMQIQGKKRNSRTQYMLNQSFNLSSNQPVDRTVRPSQTGGCWR